MSSFVYLTFYHLYVPLDWFRFNKFIKSSSKRIFSINYNRRGILLSTKMPNTSEKHRKFVAEQIGDKSVTELAGVDEVLGEKLKTAGFDKARNVLGQFLKLNRDETRFQEWMSAACDASAQQSSDCYQCLKAWSEINM